MSNERRHEMGEGGACVCSKCKTRTPHRSGIPCREEPCPKCGAKMLREGSEHHRLWLEQQQQQQQDTAEGTVASD